MPKAIGIFAKAMFQAIEKSEAMQAAAAMYIKEEYAIEDDEKLSLEGLEWDKLISKLETARLEGREEEFEAELAQLIMPLLQQVINPPQEPQ